MIDAAGHVAGAYAPAVDLGPLGSVPVQAPALLLDGLALGYYAAVARTLDLDGSRAKRSAFLGRFWRLQAGCLALAFYEHRAPQTGRTPESHRAARFFPGNKLRNKPLRLR